MKEILKMKRKFKNNTCIRLGLSIFTVSKGYIVRLGQKDPSTNQVLVEFPDTGIDWFYIPYILAITEEV